MTTGQQPGAIVPAIELRHRLRIAREHAGLEQLELFERTGISRATISAAENGHTRPHNSTLRAWALATGVDYAWLRTGNAAGSISEGDRAGQRVA